MMEIREEHVDEILADAHALAYPRYPGTDGDRRAITWVAGKLAAAGLDVSIEEFTYDIRPAFRALRALTRVCSFLIGAAGLLAATSPLVAGLPLIAALAFAAFFLGWSPWLERIYAGEGPTRTANVAGWRRLEKPRATVILLAHHDSKSQNLTFPWRMGMTLAAILGSLTLAGWLIAAVAGASVAPDWLPRAAGLAAAFALAVLSTLRSGNLSPGGVDNAGSLAIVLQLAKLLPAAAPDDVEWIFLSPGAEEDHMVGAMRWLDRHRDELAGRPVWAINFDGAGNPGRVALLERFGFGRAFSPALSAAARRRAAALGIRVRGVVMPPGMGIDAIPFAHRGVDCLTLSSGSLGKATIAIHSVGDVAENLDRATVHEVTRLAAALALEMAGARTTRGCRAGDRT
jgi:acetylornithine deacetylase/succinyl-diaminopimelate desuccinylase-like protein